MGITVNDISTYGQLVLGYDRAAVVQYVQAAYQDNRPEFGNGGYGFAVVDHPDRYDHAGLIQRVAQGQPTVDFGQRLPEPSDDFYQGSFGVEQVAALGLATAALLVNLDDPDVAIPDADKREMTACLERLYDTACADIGLANGLPNGAQVSRAAAADYFGR